MKPLDFVKTKEGNIGMITEVSRSTGTDSETFKSVKYFQCSVSWLLTMTENKCAWWSESELEVIDSLPDLLSRNLSHPFGSGSVQPFRKRVRIVSIAEDAFKIEKLMASCYFCGECVTVEEFIGQEEHSGNKIEDHICEYCYDCIKKGEPIKALP